MKVRIKFSKQGNLRFIGHLDVMRYFQKAMRRAGLDIRYSEGMSPHMIMSFASPLGIGLTSDCEYMDVEFASPVEKRNVLNRLNAVMADGFRILDMTEVAGGKAGKAMSLVAAADYTVALHPEYEKKPGSAEIFRELSDPAHIQNFLSLSSIEVEKEGKNGTRTVDIRPMIYEMRAEGEKGIFMKTAAGSLQNLKPGVLMNEYARFLDLKLPECFLHINRTEIYARADNKNASAENAGDCSGNSDGNAGGEIRFIPLGDMTK